MLRTYPSFRVPTPLGHAIVGVSGADTALEAQVGGRFYGDGGGTGGKDSASAPMQRGGGLLTLDTNSNNNSVRVNLSISLCEFSNGSGVKGEGYTGLAAMEGQGVTLNHPTTCHANSAGGVICPPKHFWMCRRM